MIVMPPIITITLLPKIHVEKTMPMDAMVARLLEQIRQHLRQLEAMNVTVERQALVQGLRLPHVKIKEQLPRA